MQGGGCNQERLRASRSPRGDVRRGAILTAATSTMIIAGTTDRAEWCTGFIAGCTLILIFYRNLRRASTEAKPATEAAPKIAPPVVAEG